MASGNVADLLHWVNAEVAKLSGTGLSKMASVLKEAEKEVTQDLAKWLARVNGDTKFTAQVYRNALIQIRGALLSIEQRSPLVAQVLKFGATQASVLATKHLIAEVEKFSLIHEGTIRPVALEASTILAEGKKTLWPRMQNSAARYTGQVAEDIRKQLAIGVVRGETVDQLTTRLVKLGGPKGHVALRGQLGKPGAVAEHITEGLFKRYRGYAERLVRTETVNAYNQLALEGISELNAEDPGYKKRWDAAIDGRTCAWCHSYDHEVVDEGKNFHGGVQAPPVHPNCRCAVVLWRAEWSETKDLKRSKHGEYGPEEDFKPSAPKAMAPVMAPVIPHSPVATATASVPQALAPAPMNMSPIARDEILPWYDKIADKYTADEMAAYEQYQGSDYRKINGQLRGSEKLIGDEKKRIDGLTKTLQSGVNKSVAERDMLVYRGSKHDLLADAKPGDVFLDKGFMSTSVDGTEAKGFAGRGGTYFEIEVPKGQRISPMMMGKGSRDFGMVDTEGELLLPHGVKMEVISSNLEAGVRNVRVRIVE